VGDGVSHPTEIVELAPGSVGTREPTGVPAGLDIGDDPDERRKLRVVDLRQLEIRLPGLPMSILDVVDDDVVDRGGLRPVGGVRLDESPESLLEQRDAIEEADRGWGLVDVRTGEDPGDAVLPAENVELGFVQRRQHFVECGIHADRPIQRDRSGVVGDRIVGWGVR